VGGSIFVLLVDDDTAFADAAARSFESVGMRTALALGSMVGIDVFDSNAIDVIITDIKLPASEPQGLALMRMIKNKRPHAPIILMTAHPELVKKDDTLPSAALCKPLEIAELCRAIRVSQRQRPPGNALDIGDSCLKSGTMIVSAT
jgi:two-component system, NtrC family, response regulator